MEIIKNFVAGELIFKQGEPGDGMLMIRDGSVEVFKETPEGEVLLTVQGVGEVIGMLTFFTGANRLASARARTPVEGQLISRAQGQDPLAKLPKWVQVVLKEFTMRLDQINDQFARTVHTKNSLLERSFDMLFISTQVANSLAELGPLKTVRSEDGREMVPIADLVKVIGSCLAYQQGQIERIMEVFKSSELIKTERSQNKDVFPLSGVARLKWYVEFVQSSRSGKEKRLIQTPLPVKLRKQLFALKDYVAKTGADPAQPYVADLNILSEQFEHLMGAPFDVLAIEFAEKLELIDVKRSPDKVSLSFNPADLVRTLTAITVVRRLRSEPGTTEADEG